MSCWCPGSCGKIVGEPLKERPQGALALEQVTAPQPGLVDCPWSWDSLHPSAKLGRACREYDCVHEDSPLVQLRLKRLSRTIAGERSSSNMLLSAPCLLCYSFLPFASGCILGKKTTGALSSLSQNPLIYTEVLPAARQSSLCPSQARWRVGLLLGCGFGTWDGRSTSSFLPGKVRTGGFWPHLETENTEVGSKFLPLTVSLHPRCKKESVPPVSTPDVSVPFTCVRRDTTGKFTRNVICTVRKW